MKRGAVDADLVARLAQLSGFQLDAERCRLLAPQLEWVMEEAGKIEALDREGIEPANFFQPQAWMSAAGEEQL